MQQEQNRKHLNTQMRLPMFKFSPIYNNTLHSLLLLEYLPCIILFSFQLIITLNQQHKDQLF